MLCLLNCVTLVHCFHALYVPPISPPPPSVSPSFTFHCRAVQEDGREVVGRSVGIITVWRTRMDLYAISVVGCCANLPLTNGTAVYCRSTSCVHSNALAANLFIWWPGSFLCHVWIYAAGPFMWKQTCRQTKMGPQDVEFKHETWIRLFKKKASLWLPLSHILICLSAACSVSCTSSSIALTGPGQHQGHRELDEDL